MPRAESRSPTQPAPARAADAGDELLSDLPAHRRQLGTAAYREGVAHGTASTAQRGFDDGYRAGAEAAVVHGLRAGAAKALARARAAAGRPPPAVQHGGGGAVQPS